MPRQAKDGSFPSDNRPSKWDGYDPAQHMGAANSFSWGDTDADLLMRAIWKATENGDAISFATNRNNSAGSITILSGPNRPRIPAFDVQAANELLVEIIRRYSQ